MPIQYLKIKYYERKFRDVQIIKQLAPFLVLLLNDIDTQIMYNIFNSRCANDALQKT